MTANSDLIERLRERARIRRQIPGRKSAEEGKPDRIADILDEAAAEIERLQRYEADEGDLGICNGCGQPIWA